MLQRLLLYPAVRGAGGIYPAHRLHSAKPPGQYHCRHQRQYESESRTAVLSGYFAALAILISCLGLFGLATFTAQKRQKEIGIRKVVGASASRITTMLSMDFLKLVGIALLIAFPLAGWIMQQWLQDYVYKTSIGAPVFLFASGLILLITVLAVGSQAIRAAMGNPVKALRSE